MSKIKNKQHYVFQEYLRNWSDNKEKIWVCNIKEKRTFYASTSDVLNKRRMYKIQDMNEDEKAFFEIIMTALKLNNLDKSEMRNHVDAYLLPYKYQEFVEALKKVNPIPETHPLSGEIKKGFEDLESIIKEQKANTEEDFYSDYEGDGCKWINSIINGDTSFYYGGNSRNAQTENGIYLPIYQQREEFLNFLCIQYFRTNGMRNSIEKNIVDMIDITREVDRHNFNIDNIRPESILPHMIWLIQAKCSAALSGQGANLQVIRNDTSLPFITGDQPIINMKKKGGDVAPKEFVLYYPLSPKVAIIVNGSDSHKEKRLDKKIEVDELNCMILEHSYEYIVSNIQDVLDGIIDFHI